MEKLKKKGRTENKVKVGKIIFDVILDRKIFTCLKNKK